MLRLIGALLALMWMWVLATDDPPAGPPEDPPEDKPEDPPEDKTGRFTQEDVDRIVSERLEREKRKAERDKEETERKAREAALKEQQDYKKLAEEQEKTLSEREKRIEDLEAIETERDEAKSRIEALEERLRGILKPQLERVPELFREFVEAKSPEEQAEWFEKNSEKLQTNGGKPTGSRPTGKPSGDGAPTEAAKDAREGTRHVSRI